MSNRSAPLSLASTLGIAIAAAISCPAFAQELVVPNAGAASAAETAPGVTPSGPVNWLSYNARPLTPAAGMWALHGDFVANVSSGRGGKPFWITPNVFVGVTDKVAVGIAENPQAEFLPVGGGLCLGGSGYCNKVLNFLGPNLLISVSRSDAGEVVVHGGVDFYFSPQELSARVGALMKFNLPSDLAIMADPTVVAGITDRSAGNKDYLYVPIRLGYQVSGQANLGLITGLNGSLDGNPGFSDNYSVPVGVAALVTPNDNLDVGLTFLFTSVGGPHQRGVGPFTDRSLSLTVNYRL